MKKAFQKDDALLHDILSTRWSRGDFRIWWLGQSGYLIQWEGKHLLIDPYLSDSLSHKYAETDKPHIRLTELVIDPRKLDFIDIATSSHNHTDHLDGETLIPLRELNPQMQLIIPEANREFVANRIKCDINYPLGLNDGEKIEVGAFSFHGIPAAHNELERDEKGNCKYMGYVIQFGPWSIYHSGDTLWRKEILEALQAFEIDLALLPINGNKPERRVAGNLDAKEAVNMAKVLNARMVFPCHYDMFSFNTADPSDFEKIAQEQAQAYKILLNGESWSSARLKGE
ncbi:MAG: MBL fold metallo-hydrolase [Bacteroidia bacterium]|nr:MBL fold metallo-hydrolase [Bacteroidia bacterium]